MAQYLDLTGLTYFKSKLLSSALHFYTGGGTTSNVTFDFGRMKSGSSIEREIYLNVQDADGIYSNTITISDGGLVLSGSGASATSPSTVNVKVNQIQLSKPDTTMTGDTYNINMIDNGLFLSGSQSSMVDPKIALIVNSDSNNTHHILNDSECADHSGSDIVLKDTQLILRAYNWSSPSKITLNDTYLHLDNMYLYGGSGTIGAGQCVLGYDSIYIGSSYGVGDWQWLERCSQLTLGEAGYTNISIGGTTANINLGTGSGHNFTVTANNFSSGKTNNEAYIKIGSTTITETQLQALLALLGSTIGTAQVGTATVV